MESSFVDFRNFIASMSMGKLRPEGEFTLALIIEGEGFIQEKLDRFFGSPEWLVHFDKVAVQHLMKQTSDHVMLVLDTQPERSKAKSRYVFEAKWTKRQETEDLINDVWKQDSQVSRMYRLQQKLKSCKQNLITWRKLDQTNSRKEKELIQKEMEGMQLKGEDRDWNKWKQLKGCLQEAYQEEKDLWAKKARVNWLQEGDRNTKYFHAVTAERRKRNRLDCIKDETGTEHK